jgi:short-subunit dehydrogenase
MWAVVTGASSGIGEAYARRLARDGYDVALVGRSAERLAIVGAAVREGGVQARVASADLSSVAGVEAVEQLIRELEPAFFVHAAGFGIPGTFASTPLEDELAMVAVHVTAAVRLARAALPRMVAAQTGSVVLVSSIGAFLARPGDSVYCGSKAFLVRFAQALSGELPAGVRVQALCPGFTRTRFHDRSPYSATAVRDAIPAWMWASPEEVVDSSQRALARGRVVHVPGAWNRLLATAGSLGLGAPLARILETRLAKRV